MQVSEWGVAGKKGRGRRAKGLKQSAKSGKQTLEIRFRWVSTYIVGDFALTE